jgi:hypothetical protein
MHAAAINPASSAPAGPTGLGQSPAAAEAGAGFEALLAALSPTQATAAAPVQTGEAQAQPTDEDDATDADTAAVDAAAQPAVTDLASVAAAFPAPAGAQPTPATTADTSGSAAAPPAWGRGKGPHTPAQPALLNANANAHLAAKAGLEPPAVDEAAAPATEAADTAPVADRDQKPTKLAADAINIARESPPAWGRDKAPGVPGAPALEHANAQADLASKLPAVDEAPPQVDAAPPAETPPNAESLLAANGGRRPEPAPPPAPEGRASKSGREKALSEAGRPADAPAVEGAKPAGPAKTADAAANPIAAGDRAEAKPEQADASSSDTSDLSLQADSRATGAQGSPSTATSHPVRGGPETVATLAAQIIRKLEGKSTRFDLELDPAGLGKVDVRVEISPHGRMTAALTCDNPQAAAELRARAPELQRALEQAGFTLAGGLSFDVADGGGGGRGQGWQDQSDTGGPSRSQAFRAALDTAAETDVAGSLNLRPRRAAGIDLRI